MTALPRTVLLALACCLAPLGCVPLDSCLRPSSRAPVGQVVEVAAVWKPEVFFASDLTNCKRPGLAGHIYLLGPNSLPVAADGPIQVALYNDDAPHGDGPEAPLEMWILAAEDLPQFLRKDLIGWNYFVALPWTTYHPAIHHIHLTVCYRSKAGPPLTTESGPITLQPPDAIPGIQQAAYRPRAAAGR
jgi:hypothetical protein